MVRVRSLAIGSGFTNVIESGRGGDVLEESRLPSQEHFYIQSTKRTQVLGS